MTVFLDAILKTMTLPLRWFSNQLSEIKQDPVLRVYGAILALTHALTAFFWRDPSTVHSLSNQEMPACWPGFDFCTEIPRFSVSLVESMLSNYGSFAVIVALLFCLPGVTFLGFLGLIFLSAVKLAIMTVDIRTALNAHTVVYFVSFVFLFLPYKRTGIKLTLIAVYFTAGLIKLNMDWISGDSLGKIPKFLQILPVWFLTTYVILLELVIVWLILSKRQWLYWIGFLQLLVFQTIAWSFIGFYFPSIMLMLLCIFPLDRHLKKSSSDISASNHDFPMSWRVSIACYLVLQLIPHWISKNPDYTGEGKYFALHMFDAPIKCEPKLKFMNAAGVPEEIGFWPMGPGFFPGRLLCNPVTLYWRARAACKVGFGTFNPNKYIPNKQPNDFDLTVGVKKKSDSEFRSLIDVKGFCSSNLKYKALTHNQWLKID